MNSRTVTTLVALLLSASFVTLAADPPVSAPIQLADLLNDLKRSAEKAVGASSPTQPAAPTSLPGGEPPCHRPITKLSWQDMTTIHAGDILIFDSFGPSIVTSAAPSEGAVIKKGNAGVSGGKLSLANLAFGSPRQMANVSWGGDPSCITLGGNWGAAHSASIRKQLDLREILKPGTPRYKETFDQNRLSQFVPEPLDNVKHIRKGDIVVLENYSGHVYFATEDYQPGQPGIVSLAYQKRARDLTSDRVSVDEEKGITSQRIWRVVKVADPGYADALWKWENRKNFNYGITDPNMK